MAVSLRHSRRVCSATFVSEAPHDVSSSAGRLRSTATTCESTSNSDVDVGTSADVCKFNSRRCNSLEQTCRPNKRQQVRATAQQAESGQERARKQNATSAGSRQQALDCQKQSAGVAPPLARFIHVTPTGALRRRSDKLTDWFGLSRELPTQPLLTTCKCISPAINPEKPSGMP